VLTWLSDRVCPAAPAGDFKLPRGRVTFADAPGRPGVDVEVARTDAHRSRGLMYRRGLPEDSGMLFAWPRDEPRAMWMRDTCVLLDILFIRSDGRVAHVAECARPLDDRQYAAREPVAYVLEVNAGWARRHGVRAGQYADVEGA